MKVTGVLVVPALGGFFHDDLAAIAEGAQRDGERYLGAPRTAGFTAVRMPARALRIGLCLSDGLIAWGDALSVQYAGAADRDPPLDPETTADALRHALEANVVGADAADLQALLRAARATVTDVGRSTQALAYGLSQAAASAVAYATRSPMAGALAASFGLAVRETTIPLYAQSGDDRHGAVDKMIAKQVDALPHGLINSERVFGHQGVEFVEYVEWVAARVGQHGDPEYQPTLHFDIYGNAGRAYPGIPALSEYLLRVEIAASPYAVRVESPLIASTRGAQIGMLAELRGLLRSKGSRLQIVADEWCNDLNDTVAFAAAEACDMIQLKMPDLGWLDETMAAVATCREQGVAAFLGGSCTETDVSAKYSVHVGLAANADLLLAKPGMGVDEGIMIVQNELLATIAALGARRTSSANEDSRRTTLADR